MVQLKMGKYIVTHEAGGARYSNAYIIANYDHSLATILRLAAIARTDFDVKDADIEFRTVEKSGWCKGFLVAFFRVETDTVKDGWRSTSKLVDVVLA